jgi:hypothetical protein
MRFKKNIVYCFLAIFLIAKVEPVFPYLSQMPQLVQNLIYNMSAFYNGNEHVDVFADIEVDSSDDASSKSEEKEGEKEGAKSAKEECKMLLHSYTTALILNQSSDRTLFHLHHSGKERNHVNEVFRPPLV